MLDTGPASVRNPAFAPMALLAATVFAATLLFAAEPPPRLPHAPPSPPVDVNSADVKTLETLPGVGPVLAQRMFEGRPYKSLLELEKVKGLGPAKIEALKDLVLFGPVPAASGTAAIRTVKPSAPPTSKPLSQKANAAAPERLGTTRPVSATANANAPGKLQKGEKININTATVEQLERLPGIGPAKARAIVDYRVRNGSFKTVEEIQKVKGIKTGAFSRVKNVIKVTD